jgi:hypothetical protein
VVGNNFECCCCRNSERKIAKDFLLTCCITRTGLLLNWYLSAKLNHTVKMVKKSENVVLDTQYEHV